MQGAVGMYQSKPLTGGGGSRAGAHHRAHLKINQKSVQQFRDLWTHMQRRNASAARGVGHAIHAGWSPRMRARAGGPAVGRGTGRAPPIGVGKIAAVARWRTPLNVSRSSRFTHQKYVSLRST